MKAEWQPIATAPRDGTFVLVFTYYGEMIVAAWLPWRDASYPYVWQTQSGDNLYRPWKDEDEPSHWMSLPPEP